jgi:pyruvate/2-oxoglutarate dehydrogenase complex dihydrolipoamide acyltransferase (E2) component
LLRQALDVCVFAPVGMAVTVKDELPDLVTKGRTRVEQDLNNARVVGRWVVAREWRRVTNQLDRIFGDEAAPDAAPAPAPEEPAATPAPKSAPPPPPAAAPRAVPDAAAEAIVGSVLADYDTLSASQVVRRLESLGPYELRAVQRYESSTRNRRTILNRASQLLDQGPAAAHSG